jgi:hypothetical protein
MNHKGPIYAGPEKDECLCAACELAREVFGEGRLWPKLRREFSPVLGEPKPFVLRA